MYGSHGKGFTIAVYLQVYELKKKDKKDKKDKTKQNKKAEEKTVIRVRLVIMKFKRHFRTLKTAITLKRDIEISVA